MSEKITLEIPYIGIDESGKGDYFGPLVIAAFLLDEVSREKLIKAGVRDSKTIADKKCRELAAAIRNSCKGKFEEVQVLPDKYNTLYAQFKKEGKNLNHLLAWGHARALESLLIRHSSKYAVADQFGNEKYIQARLMDKGKKINLVQAPKAEKYLAVAAASILARDRFLSQLQKLGEQYEMPLPKGASSAVVETARLLVGKAGKEILPKVAKTHFKTTLQVLEGQVSLKDETV